MKTYVVAFRIRDEATQYYGMQASNSFALRRTFRDRAREEFDVSDERIDIIGFAIAPSTIPLGPIPNIDESPVPNGIVAHLKRYEGARDADVSATS